MRYIQNEYTEEVVDNLDPRTKDKLLKLLLKEQARLRSGIVWSLNNATVEEFEPKLETSIPFLRRRHDWDVNAGSTMAANHIIKGNNFRVLTLLQHKYRGHIGFIYGNVPFNLGLKDFYFNGASVEQGDAWRHSKWLSYMDKRVRLMKRLLKPSGVIALSISDQELAQLILLMDEVFGQKNRISISPVISNPGGKRGSGVSTQHEYVLIYANNIALALEERGLSQTDITGEESSNKWDKVKNFILPVETTFQRHIGKVATTSQTDRKFEDKVGPFNVSTLARGSSDGAENTFFPVYYIPQSSPDDYLELSTRKKIDRAYLDTQPNLSLEVPNCPHISVWPVDAETGNKKKWRWGKEKMRLEIEKGRSGVSDIAVRITYTSNRTLVSLYSKDRARYLKSDQDEGIAVQAKALQSIFGKSAYANSNASVRISQIFGEKQEGEYAKPVPLIEDLILAFGQEGEYIADFFAGNGETGEAVLNLNKKHDRCHRFILVSEGLAEKACERFQILGTAQLRGKKAPKSEPLPCKVLAYELGHVDTGQLSEDDFDFDLPEVSYQMAQAIEGWNTLTYGSDIVLFCQQSIYIQVNTFDKILVVTEMGWSQYGAMRDPEVYEGLCEYFKGIGDDYTKILVQYSMDETPKGVDLITDENELFVETFPAEYLKSLEFSINAAISPIDKHILDFLSNGGKA